MATSPQSIFRSNNPYESLIQKIMQYESLPKQRLESQVEDQKSLKKVVGNVDSKLSALETAITPFTEDGGNNPFSALTVDTGGSENFSASASDSAAQGTHTLEIEQLAKTDTRVTKQFDSTATSLSDWAGQAGQNNSTQTFEITVASPTDANPDNRETISVSVETTNLEGKNDEEALAHIESRIETAMSDAVDAGTIDEDEKVNVSLVNESSGTARLSIKSGTTGYTNRITFNDSQHELLKELDLGQGQQATDTGGGEVYRVGTGETDTALNSEFALDGLTLYRDSNTVTDALDGVTLELAKAGNPEEEFTVESDQESITESVKDFISKYNEAQDFIDQKTNVDEDTQERGPLAGDFTFRTLQFDLRTDAVEKVDGQGANEPAYLSDVGIEMSEDGRLSLADEGKLMNAIEDDAGAVKSLFNAPDGVATRIDDRLQTFVERDGLLDNREDGIDSKIDRIENRIDTMEQRLARQEQRLRDQYAQVQETISQFQGQQRFLQGFGIGGGQNLGGQFF